MNEPTDPLATTPQVSPPRIENPPVLVGASDSPRQIGRYRVKSVLGEGAFGRVYLAHDEELNRPIAIKVPHRDRISRPEDVSAYLAEARVVAGLDHPNIVPVFDVGQTGDGLCFVVSKFVEGSDLAHKIKHALPAVAEAASGSLARSGPTSEPLVATDYGLRSSNAVIKIVPKGLRSFDAQDADFFLELLPGPRDRDGLPDSIRFWKTRIEETDADETFALGLLYGPSGCGKSSLVKAGLLPRDTQHVRRILRGCCGFLIVTCD